MPPNMCRASQSNRHCSYVGAVAESGVGVPELVERLWSERLPQLAPDQKPVPIPPLPNHLPKPSTRKLLSDSPGTRVVARDSFTIPVGGSLSRREPGTDFQRVACHNHGISELLAEKPGASFHGAGVPDETTPGVFNGRRWDSRCHPAKSAWGLWVARSQWHAGVAGDSVLGDGFLDGGSGGGGRHGQPKTLRLLDSL